MVRRTARLLWTAVIAVPLGAGLWLGLQYGAGYEPGAAGTIAGVFSAVLVALGVAWAGLPSEPASAAPALALSESDLASVTGTFADRTAEWASIRQLAVRARNSKNMRLVVLVHGMPGVGKSEFALHAGHLLVSQFARYARRKHLTVLARQVNLHGAAGVSPTDVRDALRRQLDPRGEDEHLATMNLDQLAAEWRKYLQGKLLILVLDNARDEAQVAPFLPGASPCLVLVTSRRVLQGLLADGARSFPLDVLDPAGAVDMAESIIARPGLRGEDKRAISDIAKLCDYKPLAIKLAVQPLAGRPQVSLATRQALLKGQPDRLPIIDQSARPGPGGRDGVVQAYEASYWQLTDDARLMLRRLSLAPVPDLGVTAAAVLADVSPDAAAAILGELVLESLITEADGSRYLMHDLVKEYGRTLARREDPAGSEAAVSRLLGYYADAAARVDRLLTRQPPPEAVNRPAPVVSEALPDVADAVGWARSALPNLLACADYAILEARRTGRREDHAWVITFAAVLAGILRNGSQWRRSIDLQTAAVESASLIRLPLAEANALAERGLLHRLTAELADSAEDLERAIAVYRQVGGEAGQVGQAHARNTYGVVLDQLKKPDKANREFSAALDTYRRAGEPLGEANVLNDQGMARFFGQDYADAVRLISQALELYRGVGHPLGLAHAHSNLARAQLFTGDDRDAAANLEAAQRLYRDLGNGLGEISILVRLARVPGPDQHGRAVDSLTRAARLSRDIGNPAAEIDALEGLGDVQAAAGDRKGADATWARAEKRAREYGIQRDAVRLAAKARRGHWPVSS